VVRVKGAELPLTDSKFVGGDIRDPIVSAPLPHKTSLRMDLLSKSEVIDIDHLTIVKRSGHISLITDFSFSQTDGLIHGAVDLESGDSGSPILAMLKGGSIRYAGAVSRGNPDGAGGNIMTAVCYGMLRGGSPGGDGVKPKLAVQIENLFAECHLAIRKFKEKIKVWDGVLPTDPKRSDADKKRQKAKDRLHSTQRDQRSVLKGLLLMGSEGLSNKILGAYEARKEVLFTPSGSCDALDVVNWSVSDPVY